MEFLEKIYIPHSTKSAVKELEKTGGGIIFIATGKTTVTMKKTKMEFIHQHLVEKEKVLTMTRKELISIISEMTGKPKISVKQFLIDRGGFEFMDVFKIEGDE